MNKFETKCKHCGADNPEDANFCCECGKKLNETCVSCNFKEEKGQPSSCPGEKCPYSI